MVITYHTAHIAEYGLTFVRTAVASVRASIFDFKPSQVSVEDISELELRNPAPAAQPFTVPCHQVKEK